MNFRTTAFHRAAEHGTADTARRTSWRRHPIVMTAQLIRSGLSPVRRTRAAVTPTTSSGELLRRLRDLPIGLWSYGWESDRTRHLGPMAQDFHRSFGLGSSDRRIDLGDAIGVCMATICEVAQRLEDLETRTGSCCESGQGQSA